MRFMHCFKTRYTRVCALAVAVLTWVEQFSLVSIITTKFRAYKCILTSCIGIMTFCVQCFRCHSDKFIKDLSNCQDSEKCTKLFKPSASLSTFVTSNCHINRCLVANLRHCSSHHMVVEIRHICDVVCRPIGERFTSWDNFFRSNTTLI